MKYLSAMILALVLATPALAGSCPMLASQIDRQLQSQPALGETERRDIEKLRDKGMQHHDKGEHAQAMDALNRALARLEEATETQ